MTMENNPNKSGKMVHKSNKYTPSNRQCLALYSGNDTDLQRIFDPIHTVLLSE
jgi:hypothetical protein